ncbi:MAG: hypothetical protein J7M38_03465 [Armatimonadetes bacterium]|nr:hypothetical protein [Armatimonadota bacterium]
MLAKARTRRARDEKLSLMDAVGMAVGGMVGGGIFAVLGVVLTRRGGTITRPEKSIEAAQDTERGPH